MRFLLQHQRSRRLSNQGFRPGRALFAAATLLILSVLPFEAVHASVKLNGLFTSGAVLQQGIRAPVWGTAKDGEKVTVSIANQRWTTVARSGKWSVRLNPIRAGGPYTLTVSGTNKLSFTNILVGEVYICSGQSNMEWPLSLSANAAEAAAGAADPLLRLYTVPKSFSDSPRSNISGRWEKSTPDTARTFSAVAYFFGRSLRQHLNVPVGLIQAAWGGTPAQAWTGRAALLANPTLEPIVSGYEKMKRDYDTAQAQYPIDLEKARQAGADAPPAPRNPTTQNSPAALYNAMIYPLIPYGIRGVIWYQGESDTGAAHQYETLFPALINNWRTDWRQGDFPFLFVQIAPFMTQEDSPAESAWAELREAQRRTSLNVPNTGMAVITDAGDENDISPRDKQTPGERLALLARATVYKQDIEAYGPVYNSVDIQGDKAIVHFTHTGSGLEARGTLRGFTVTGEDQKFVNATAVIKGDTVEVSAPGVAHPVAVRYGWADYPTGNLWNKAGLPASPFRTDNFPLTAP